MDWRDTPEEARFREQVRSFVAERFPADYEPDPTVEHSLEPEDLFGYNWPADRRTEDAARRSATARWTAALAERGWAAPHWPPEYGGAGLSVMEHHVLQEEMAQAGVPLVGGIGVSMLGPTLIAHGSEEQCRTHLPRIVAGDVAWAQGFSEPAAGSDLASLAMRAVREGDEFVVSGQKIWTSHAQFADWICLLVRTDPEQPRHRGLTYLLVDLNTPGITVRRILDMADGHPFCEVFVEEARVPVANLVGEESRGWYVAMAMLDFERAGAGAAVIQRRLLEELVAEVRARRGSAGLAARPALRAQLADRAVELAVREALTLRTVTMHAAGLVPQNEASANQLFGAELQQRLARTAIATWGLHGPLVDGARAIRNGRYAREYLWAAPQTVISGTSEIQRQIIATRGLGLPRS
jgi:alkylation response protein AidB-like acyl-CoA dehydrogenase